VVQQSTRGGGIKVALCCVARRVLSPRLRSVHDLPGMVRASSWVLCLATASCAASRHDWEPAGTGTSLQSRDRSLEQVFRTDDEAAKAACRWLWENEPKAREFEYCGFILLAPDGYKATVPMTRREQSRCPRPSQGPPGETVAGWYHSHRVLNEFSPTDRSHGLAIALYLCAPNELVKKLTPEGTVIVK